MLFDRVPLVGTAARYAKAQRILKKLCAGTVSNWLPDVQHAPDGTGVLHSPVTYRWQDEALEEWQSETVPAGFVFDGASKPRATWPVVGHPWGRSLLAAIGHDWDFVTRPRLSDGSRMTLEYAAAKYALFLERWGCGWMQRQAEMLAVVSLPALTMWRKHDGEFVD